jgi:serine/threonine-protein kinase
MITPTFLNNRYKVLSVLGSGGFGDTFLAEDTQMPSSRRCVIKQLKPVANNNPQIHQLVQERFQREAAILEELGENSPQIPKLYAYFNEGGEFYLVQEYIEGQTLTQKLQQQGSMSESSVKSILIDILPILSYVHSKHIVHRDIKPDNIMIRNFDGKAILIDFGAVKETMGTVMTNSGNSASSIVIGTPGFMPMEQSAGRPQFNSDLYSLGLTAIYLLTGKLPQELPTNPHTGEILWRQYALNVSPSLAMVLDKCILPVARDRYPSARDMLAELQPVANPVAPTVPYTPPQYVAPVPSPIAKPTVVSPAIHSSGNNTSVMSPKPQNNTDNQGIKGIPLGSIVVGVLVGGSIILASTLLNQKPSSQTSEAVQTNQPQVQRTMLVSEGQTTESIPTNRSVVQEDGQTNFSQTQQSIPRKVSGWIRIGAVDNNEQRIRVGEKLIKTTQEITILPAVVPSVGDTVTILTGVNLRKNSPQPPQYDLPEVVGKLGEGQRIVIRNLNYFVDRSVSPYTTVWAEIDYVKN